MDSQKRQRLVQEVSKAYQFTRQEQEALARSLYQHTYEAARASYLWGSHKLGIALPEDWELPKALLQELAERSVFASNSIAQTYHQALEHQAGAGIDAYEEQHQERSALLTGSIILFLLLFLLNWLSSFLDWKIDQIASTEITGAADAGSRQLVVDIQVGVVILGGDLTPDSIQVAVVPEDSSRDFCKRYAGYVFSLDDAGFLPAFPVHPNCIHRTVLLINGIIADMDTF